MSEWNEAIEAAAKVVDEYTDTSSCKTAILSLKRPEEVCDPNTCSNGKCNITGQCINQLYLDSQK